MTNKDAMNIIATSKWMCIDGDPVAFADAIEHAHACLAKIERIEKANMKLIQRIKDMQCENGF